MEEWKIGEIRQIDNEWYQCLESNSCRCDYCDYGELGDCHKIACASGERSDDKEVHFKKLKKVGKPYYNSDNKLCQEYKCYIVPLITDDIVYVLADNRAIIEVKQNKEENMEEKKLNLKSFDLDAAKQGKPVCTRDGRKARIICFDKRGGCPIIALVEPFVVEYDCIREETYYYTTDGCAIGKNAESKDNLMMLPEKKEGWVNVYKDGLLGTRVHNTKKEAFANASPKDYVATVKINWEE